MTRKTYIVSETLPREVVPGLYWLGGCSDTGAWPGRVGTGPEIHEPCCAFVIVGSDKTLMVDTGHFGHWYALVGQLDKVLNGRTLDFLFPTHPEIPHTGNLGRWMLKYPNAVAVGDVRDYHLFYPMISRDRFIDKHAGDSVDLGDTSLVFLDAVWKDLSATMWGYDPKRRALFSSDGVGFLHEHDPNVCGLFASELPPQVSLTDERFFALPFLAMQYRDMKPTVKAFRDLLAKYPVEVVCSAHGVPVTKEANMEGFIDALLRAVLDPDRVPKPRDKPGPT